MPLSSSCRLMFALGSCSSVGKADGLPIRGPVVQSPTSLVCVTCVVKALGVVNGLKKHYINTVHLLYLIFNI